MLDTNWYPEDDFGRLLYTIGCYMPLPAVSLVGRITYHSRHRHREKASLRMVCSELKGTFFEENPLVVIQVRLFDMHLTLGGSGTPKN